MGKLARLGYFIIALMLLNSANAWAQSEEEEPKKTLLATETEISTVITPSR